MIRTQDNLGTALMRQKWVVLGTILVTVTCAYSASYLMPPLYRAEARVIVEPSRYSPQALATEAQTLRSTAVTQTVIQSLSLQQDTEWTAPGQTPVSPKFLRLNSGAPVEAPGPDATVTASVMNALEVRPVTGSYVLSIMFTSKDAEKSARIANAFADAYVKLRAPSAETSGELVRQIAELRNSLTVSEDQIKSFVTAPAPQMPEALAQERAALLAQQAELSKRYGPRHPRMVELMASLAALEQKSKASVASPLPQLEARAAEQRQLLDNLTHALKAQPQNAENQTRIVSPATPPITPERMMPGWMMGSIPGLGLLLGLFLALFNDRFDRGYRNQDALEDESGFPCLADVPVPERNDPKLSAHILQKPSSEEAEAVRALRAGLKLAAERAGRPLKVITMTSSLPQEARSLVAVWLARLAARSGEKVLLVDADLREPQIHGLLGASNTPSLVDYLTGQTHLEQIVWKKDMSGMHVIFASPVPNTALDLISSEKMKKLTGYLRQSYDLVLLNAPACLASADAALLANESDQTLYLVSARHTPRSLVRKGLKLFADFGYTSISPVLLTVKKFQA